MLELNKSIVKKVFVVYASTDYMSETHRAEAMADLFSETPKELRINVIDTLLSFYGSTNKHINPKNIGKLGLFVDEELSSAISSEYVGEFSKKAYGALAKNSLKEVVEVIFLSVNNAPNFAHRVAIFMQVLTNLRVSVFEFTHNHNCISS